MLYQKNFFSALTHQLTQRSERAAQGLLSLGNEHLRHFLHQRLTGMPGQPGSWLADPVFEPTFGWEESAQTMASLAGSSVLNHRLAEVLANPPPEFSKKPTDYSFPGTRHPFKHQLKAWEILNQPEPQSLVVTSGTGSGKTECFLVPVLNHLANEVESGENPEGVRALFIYPLNALINSQQNRLDAYTDGFAGQIRHCLYTGALESELPAADQRYSGQVIDRKSLRDSPPQILVTNATMLEYMLVRKDDEPILQKSAGKLRWIILDEAHTHIGSQAAEMALLLRRVMLAFKVKPQDVRFVATSATFGSDDQTIEDLRTFLADIGGIAREQVQVVQGRRDIPQLPPAKPTKSEDTPDAIAAIEPDQEQSTARFQRLEASPTARQLRSLFIQQDGNSRPRSLDGLAKDSGLATPQLLAWLDLLTGTRNADGNADGIAFLPLRTHLFHNVIPAIRACIDPHCTHRAGTPLAHAEWPYGMVYLEERTHCDCGAPLMPLVSCEECNASFLQAAQTSTGKLIDKSRQQLDEFALEIEQEDENQAEDEHDLASQLLITNRKVDNSYPEYMERDTQKLAFSASGQNYIELQIFRSATPECPCCSASSPGRSLLRPARIGTPFTLSTVISTLLEFCPQDKEPAGKPFQGRKLISFTDSRQGTARIAVKLQQDSERNRIRGLVYHHLLHSQPGNVLTAEEQQDLQDLQQQSTQHPLGRFEQKYLQQLEEKLLQANSGAEASWNDLVNHLANTPDVQVGMLDYYNGLAPRTFGKDDSRELAGMLLAREFYRRPKRANSLETLGLVQVSYPKLADIHTKPMGWSLDLQSWRDYLKVLLDFLVRENSMLNLDQKWLSLIGARIRPKWVMPPLSDGKTEKLTGRFTRWPSVNTAGSQSRAVLLLCKAFNWTAKTHRDQIDSILRDAWHALTQQAKLLTPAGDGYQLQLKELSFRLPAEVYLCRVSRRFLDTPFAQLSPYTPRTVRDLVVKVEPRSLPRPPEALLHLAGEDGLLAIRDWLDSQEAIQQLRREALWTDIMDRIVEGGHYFRAAEHSAQQPKEKLGNYESLFNHGKLNLLSCSTTMEMGVDIGGISVVAMNNVPPHPANYLQRAGRAGRRREGRSVALTVCKNTPHDQGVFRNPLWPFTTPMRMPRVSLQSPELVQRHINAWLLSHWLKRVIAAEELKSMTAGAFFLKADLPLSLAERFCLWCGNQMLEASPEVQQAVADIIRRSILGSTPQAVLLGKARDSLQTLTEAWLQEHSVTAVQLKQIGNKKAAAYRAMRAQLGRIEQEYLLSELADRRFLPGYGFPTDIVSFDNQCLQTLKQESTDKREDNRARYRDLASRDRVTGLREYAPGAELVMDGLVYRSAGITLNWHAPASQEHAKELQLFKKSWFCRHCGSSGTTSNPALELDCQACGTPIEHDKIKQYLVPAGFAVDFFDDPHNDVSQLQYIPVERPLLNIPANWIGLANPALGRFRASQHAQLFNHSSGAHGNGFAICLECGKAEPMLIHPDSSAPANEQYLPAVFRAQSSHRRLRGGKNDDGDNICPGSQNSWKIKQNIHLGHDSLTDALELILRNPSTGAWLNNDTTGYSIAVALREAIAAELGVQSEELGCDCREVLVDNQIASSIRVFDLRSGGYTTQAAALLNERRLWERVIRRLDSCGCAHACQCCLLGFDTRFEAERLDRHAALQWINQDWLQGLALPEQLAVFGPQTRAEIATLQEAIAREIARNDTQKTIAVYFSGSAEDWDLAAARSLRRQLVEWETAGAQVQLHLAEEVFSALPRDQLTLLAQLAGQQIQICLHEILPPCQGLTLNVTIQSEQQSWAWASDNLQLIAPNRDWCLATTGSMLVCGPLPAGCSNFRQLGTDALQSPVSPGLIRIDVGSQLDGQIDGFAKRFWELASQMSQGILDPALNGTDPVVELRYSDRYVCSPLVVRLLADVIYHLKSLQGEDFAIRIEGRQYQKTDDRSPWQCWHDWKAHTERDAAIAAALDYCGLAANVISSPKLPHHRQLKLSLGSGKQLTIQLDQGLSFWEVDRSDRANQLRFNFGSHQIGEEIMERLQCKIATSHGETTQIYISVTQ